LVNPLHASAHDSLSDEVILITGAGGSIGSALAKRLAADASRLLVLLDLSEQNLYEIHAELSGATASRSESQRTATCIPILGDIRDAALLDDVFQKYRPTVILHTAAFKHVPLMEQNPIAVIDNNVLGTSVLTAAALKYRALQLLMISTDKAVHPRSIMGAAKRIAELILLRQSSAATHMSSLRLGNVLGSNGSVVPLFQQQIERGGPVSVTHPDASRYFLPLDEAIDLILSAAALDESSSILVPELGAPVKILDLAQKMIAEAVTASSTRVGTCAAGTSTVSDRPAKIEIAFAGLRPGDKLHEELLSSSETAEPTANPKLRRIRGSHLSAKIVDSAVELISEKVAARDLPAAIEAIQIVVPDYAPSEALSSLIATQLSAAAKTLIRAIDGKPEESSYGFGVIVRDPAIRSGAK
jgi:FlaA1/EpsC-like NDP-sugar epimerase